MNRTEILQTAKPILFHTDMVRATQDGRKTATRRVIKPQPIHKGRFWELEGAYWSDDIRVIHPVPCHSLYNRMPYRPGDYLYVRETWCWCPCWDCGMDTEEGCCDKSANKFYNHEKREYGCYGYKASFKDNEQPFDKWHLSIHMPKEAARIFLWVTDVRVERLQEITVNQMIEEGAIPFIHLDGSLHEEATKTSFISTWNSTLPKKDLDRYGWDVNPWVWVIEFERVEVEQ